MTLFQKIDTIIQRYRWYDISLIKISSGAFLLMVAKLWPPLLALDWYYYLAVSIVAAVPVLRKFCSEKPVPRSAQPNDMMGT